MILLDIPGSGRIQLRHLVLDYNGTLACDGRLLFGVKEHLDNLAGKIDLHVLTADTFGGSKVALEGIDCRVTIIDAGHQQHHKLRYVENLGPQGVVAIGNGCNDRLMLEAAALGIAVIQKEGAAAETLAAADVVCGNILVALDLLLNPLRLVATLRR